MIKQREGRAIPAPATQSDMYGAAIVEELERLNDNIERLFDALTPAQPQATGDVVELSEPAAVAPAEEASVKKLAHRDAKRATAQE